MYSHAESENEICKSSNGDGLSDKNCTYIHEPIHEPSVVLINRLVEVFLKSDDNGCSDFQVLGSPPGGQIR